MEYGAGPVHIIGIVEFTDGMVVTADFYFADSFEPPESRAQWTNHASP